MTKAEIKQLIKKQDVGAVSLWFVDVLGRLKAVTVSFKEINDVLENGKFIDGSSIEGFSRIEESDLLLVPDFPTFCVLPFEFEGGLKVARIICDVSYPDGKPFPHCPRQALKKILKDADKKSMAMNCGPELEYYYFRDNKSTNPLDGGTYFDFVSFNGGTRIREQTMTVLEKMGIQCECTHHEVGPSMHEIGLKYKDALTMADNIITYKFIVKMVAQQNDVYATFMPKPKAGWPGSGMHTHISLTKGGKNLFYNKKDKFNLSPMAKSFSAGVMKYAKDIFMVTDQHVNSYKRLVPGHEAPIYIAWGRANRSAFIRIPATRPGKEKSCRAEFRFPDPSCNPYLTFSALYAAGMKGVEEKLKLAAPVEEDIYEMSPAEREKIGIKPVPDSLAESIHYFEKSKLMKDLFGETLHEKLLENKRIEWQKYREQVHKYEVDTYLSVL